MSQIAREEILQIASLAKLRFNEDELVGFVEQFNRILTYVEKLEEVDTEGVEPLASVLQMTNVLRADTPGEMLSSADALKNAPKKTEGFFTVPKVLGES